MTSLPNGPWCHFGLTRYFLTRNIFHFKVFYLNISLILKKERGPPDTPVSNGFLRLFIPPPLSYRPFISSFRCHTPSLLYPLPTYYPGTKRHPPGRHLQPPHTSLRRSSLHPALRACVCRRVLWLCNLLLPPSSCSKCANWLVVAENDNLLGRKL